MGTTACAVAIAGGLPAAPAWSPAEFANVVLWVRSDDYDGEVWFDRVGDLPFITTGGGVSIDSGTFGARAGISFDGVDHLQAEGAYSELDCLHDGTGCTVLALIKPGAHADGNGVIIATDHADSASIVGGGLRHFDSVGDDRIRMVASDTGGNVLDIYSSANSVPGGSVRLVRATYGSALSPDCSLYSAGVLVGSGNLTGAAPSGSGGVAAVGGTTLGGGSPFAGHIGEIVVIAGVPSAGELASYAAYVNDYFGQAFAGA
jgi:hypothetical protein